MDIKEAATRHKELIGYVVDNSGLLDYVAKEIVSRLKVAEHSRSFKVYVFGNGGSAADASHIAGELVGRFRKDRLALPAIALTTDPAVLTAVGNDFGYDQVFARQVEAHARPCDVLWGISTSGNSQNVVNAFEKGRALGTFNFSMTGEGGGLLKGLSDVCLAIPSTDTPRIQEAHQFAYHTICELVEEKFGE